MPLGKGNKHDNGVLEVGTDEIRVSYSEDTPGQNVDAFIKEQEKAFHEQKKKVKKHFSTVFQNPLKGFPYNEEIIVTPLHEGTWAYANTLDKIKALNKMMQTSLIIKTKSDLNKAEKTFGRIIGDDRVYDEWGASVDDRLKVDARKAIVKHLEDWGFTVKNFQITHYPESLIQAEEIQERGKGNLKPPRGKQKLLKLHHKSKDKPHAHELPEAFSKKQAKGKDIAKKMMKSKTMKAFAKKVAKMSFVSPSELDKILPDYVSGGDIGALFEANLQEEMIDDFEIRFDKESDWKKADKIVQDYLKKDAPKHAKALLKKDYVHGPDPLMVAFGDTNQKLKPPVNLNDLYNAIRKLKSSRMKYWQGIPRNKEKDAVTEQKLINWGGGKPSFEEFQERADKMGGSKLTGAEISSYFRKHKVRDKTVRKAVELALDHGGAMNYAIKQIEKLKRGLSKHKDVKKALDVANFGENVSEEDVEKFFGFFTEAFTDAQIDKLRKSYAGVKGVDPTSGMGKKLLDFMRNRPEDELVALYKGKINFISLLAASNLIARFKYKSADIIKLRTEVNEAPVLPSTQAGVPTFDYSVEEGVKKYEEAINKQYQQGRFSKLHKDKQSKVVARKANKYYRVEEWEMGRAGSIHAFIDIANGDIFKPASWKAPAKGARGNIRDKAYIAYVERYPDAYYGGHLYK